MRQALSTLNDVQQWYAWFQQMRTTQPVWQDERSGYWHVFRYADVKHVITDSRLFSNEGGECLSLGAMDPPQHRHYRDLISSAFTPRTIDRLRGRVAEITQELLNEVRQEHTIDFVTALAYPLPVIVIAELLGVPSADRPMFKRWADGLLRAQLIDARFFQPETEEEGQHLRQVYEEMTDYFKAILEERKHALRSDLISALLEASVDGKRLSVEETIDFCILLLVAGHVTTTSLLSQAIRCLAEHLAALEQVRKQPELLPGAIEEVLRYASPVWRLTRQTRAEVRIAGATIPADALVIAWLSSANRDAEQFPEPERFAITRTPNQHGAFGHGIHFCIGAPLSRMEAAIALPMILKQLPNLRVANAEPLELFEGETLFGLQHLPVHFEAEEAATK